VLSKTVNGHLQSQHKYKQQQYDNTRQNKKEKTKETKNQFRLLTPKHEFLSMSVSLQTEFAVKHVYLKGSG
jgi:hypothetical protein